MAQYDRSRAYALEVQQLLTDLTTTATDEPVSDPRLDKILRQVGKKDRKEYLRHRLYWAATFACGAGALDPVETRALFDATAPPEFLGKPYPPFIEPVAEGVDWVYDRLFIQGIQNHRKFNYTSDFLPVDRYILSMLLDMGAHSEIVAESVPVHCLTRYASGLGKDTPADRRIKVGIFDEDHVYFDYPKLIDGLFPYQSPQAQGLEGFLQAAQTGAREWDTLRRRFKNHGFVVFPNEVPGSETDPRSQIVYKIQALGASRMTLRPRHIVFAAHQQNTALVCPKAIYVPPVFGHTRNPGQSTSMLDFYEFQIALLRQKDLIQGGYTLRNIKGGRLLLSVVATALLGRVLQVPDISPTSHFQGIFAPRKETYPPAIRFGEWG